MAGCQEVKKNVKSFTYPEQYPGSVEMGKERKLRKPDLLGKCLLSDACSSVVIMFIMSMSFPVDGVWCVEDGNMLCVTCHVDRNMR